MKFLFTVIFILFALTGFSQLVVYNFSGAAGNQISQLVTSTDPNLTASSLVRGSGVTAMTGTGSINSKGWTTASQTGGLYAIINNY